MRHRFNLLLILSTLVLVAMADEAHGQASARFYVEGCDGGDFLACNILGLMFESGDGVAQNSARAASLYKRACDGGEMAGCTNLGVLYVAGEGVPQDLARASALYRQACDGGQAMACANLQTLGNGQDDGPTSYQRAGRVADAETRRPLPDAVLELPTLGIRRLTDEEGRVELGRLPRGRHPVRAERSGYEPLEAEIDVPLANEVMILLNPSVLDDPDAAGRILGMVMEDGTNSPLSDVEVISVETSESLAVTDAQGRFALDGMAPGLMRLRLSRLGYLSRDGAVIVQPAGTTDMTATLSTEPIELEPLAATVRPRRLEESGFYDRANSGRGYHLTRAELLDVDPILLSDMFRRIPGVAPRFDPLQPDRASVVSRRGSTFQGGECTLPVYIDGARSIDPDINIVPPDQIEAMEIYHGLSTPTQYRREGPCGVVLIWTRR